MNRQDEQCIQDENRFFYLDLLRVLAVIATISIHVSGENWQVLDVRSYDWIISTTYNHMFGWAVPLFVMISGSLFLGRNIPTKILYKKYIFRIIVAFVVWSFLYSFVYELLKGNGIRSFVKQLILGNYHLWYLFMISGMYMIIPFLRKITENQQLTKYFLVLSFVFAIVVPQIVALLKVFSATAYTNAEKLVNKWYFNFPLGYTIYFILGYYWHVNGISKQTERIVFILGIISFVASPVASVLFSLYKNMPIGGLSIASFFQALFVFLICKNKIETKQIGKKTRIIVSRLSKYTFVTYLVHDFVIRAILKLLHGIGFCNYLFSIPITIISVVCVSYGISAILNNIMPWSKDIIHRVHYHV